MAFQKTVIPLTGGIDESVSEQVRAPQRLTDVINGRYDKQGTIIKRDGFSVVSNRIAESVITIGETENGDIRGFFSTGRELLAIGGRRLYAFNPDHDEWYDRGAISPFTSQVTRTFYGSETYDSTDCARVVSGGSGYWLYAAQGRYELTNSGGADVSQWPLRIVGKTDDGIVTVPNTTILAGGTQSTRSHSIKCVTNDEEIGVVAMIDGQGAVPTPSTLRLWSYDASTPHLAPVVESAAWQTNVYYPGASNTSDDWNNIRTYDVVEGASGEVALVWIDDTTNDVHFEVYDSSWSSLRSNSLNLGGARRVAIAYDSVNTRIVLAVWVDAGNPFPGADNELRVYSIGYVSLAVSWGPTLFDTTIAGERIGSTLGVAIGAGGGTLSARRIQVVWSMDQRTTTPSNSVVSMFTWGMHSRSCADHGGSVGSFHNAFNCVPTTDPFLHNTRFYCGFTSHNSKHHFFGYSGVYDLMEDEDESPRIAGLSDIGYAPCVGRYAYDALVSAPLRKGNNNSVVSVGNTFRYMSQSQGDANTVADIKPRVASDEVVIDFDGVVTADTVLDGSAVIGGGFVASYSGYGTCELGFPTAPFLVEFDSVAGTGGPAGPVIYYALGLWQWFDPSGVLHRSMPSPSEPHNHMVDGELLSYSALTYPGSHRAFSDVSAVFYRSSEETSNFRRVQQPHQVTPNSDSVLQTSIHHEADADLSGTFLYTQGGAELENVSPEGSAIVKVAIDRVWLGSAHRKDRISFSKPFLPGGNSEHVIAPEFNEGFVKLTPDGREVTGMAEMGDRLVLFTSDAIYWISGDGPDDRGAGSDYPPLTRIQSDTGCTEPRSVIEIPDGVMFLGQRGIYTLNRGDEIQFTGFAVVDQTDAFPTITSATLNAKTNEVYFTCNDTAGTAGQILVFNYAIGAWSRWVVVTAGGVPIAGGALHGGEYYISTPTGEVYKLDSSSHLDPSSLYVPLVVETGWFQGNEQAAWRRVRKAMPVMERVDGHELTIDIYKDFEESPHRSVTFDGAVVAGFSNAKSYQPVVHNSIQKVRSYKVRVSDADDVATSVGNHGGYTISAIMLEWLPARGLSKVGEGQRI